MGFGVTGSFIEVKDDGEWKWYDEFENSILRSGVSRKVLGIDRKDEEFDSKFSKRGIPENASDKLNEVKDKYGFSRTHIRSDELDEFRDIGLDEDWEDLASALEKISENHEDARVILEATG